LSRSAKGALAALLNNDPVTILGAQSESLHGSGLGGLPVRGFYVTENLPAASDEGDTPALVLADLRVRERNDISGTYGRA
jgi:hypothetical protein